MQTVIVTVRHPDFGNEHHQFGNDVRIVDIDQGSTFDASQVGPSDWDTVLDWAVSHYREAAEIREDGNEEAASFIEAVAEETLALCLPYGRDYCEVRDEILRAMGETEELRIFHSLDHEEGAL